MAADRIGQFTRADIDPTGTFRASDVDGGAFGVPEVPISSMTGVPAAGRAAMTALDHASRPFSSYDQPDLNGTMLSDLVHVPTKTEMLLGAAGALPFGKMAKVMGAEPKILKLWHGSPADLTGKYLDPAKSLDSGAFSWLTPSRGYAAEYASGEGGAVTRHEITIQNPLDLRAETTVDPPRWNQHAEKTLQEWVDLFRSRGVDAKLYDPDYAGETAKLWDLMHGGDIDFTRETNLGEALRASDYDALIVKEPHGIEGKPVDAYAILKPSALSRSIGTSGIIADVANAGRSKAGLRAAQDGDVRYVRFGKPPESGFSFNHRDNVAEAGVSAHKLIMHAGEWHLDENGVGFSTHLDTRPVYEIAGDHIGTGSDGEALLSNVKTIGKYKGVPLSDLPSTVRNVQVEGEPGFIGTRVGKNLITGEMRLSYDPILNDGGGLTKWQSANDLIDGIQRHWSTRNTDRGAARAPGLIDKIRAIADQNK
jgi:hypothetical protein